LRAVLGQALGFHKQRDAIPTEVGKFFPDPGWDIPASDPIKDSARGHIKCPRHIRLPLIAVEGFSDSL